MQNKAQNEQQHQTPNSSITIYYYFLKDKNSSFNFLTKRPLSDSKLKQTKNIPNIEAKPITFS